MSVQDLINLLSQVPADTPVQFASGMFGGDLTDRQVVVTDSSIVIDLDK